MYDLNIHNNVLLETIRKTECKSKSLKSDSSHWDLYSDPWIQNPEWKPLYNGKHTCNWYYFIATEA